VQTPPSHDSCACVPADCNRQKKRKKKRVFMGQADYSTHHWHANNLLPPRPRHPAVPRAALQDLVPRWAGHVGAITSSKSHKMARQRAPLRAVAAIVISAAAVACLVVAQHAKSGPFGLLSRPTQLFVSTWKALTPDGVMGADLHIRSSHRSVRTSTRAQAHKEDDKLDLFFGIHHFPGSAAGLAKARRTNGLQQRAARTTLLDSLPGHMDPTLYLQQLEQKSVLKQNAYMKSWAHKNLVAARQQQLFQARRPSRSACRSGTVPSWPRAGALRRAWRCR
jgi:hypothetical protein